MVHPWEGLLLRPLPFPSKITMTKTAKEILLTKRDKSIISPSNGLSSGSTLLNLACSENPDVAYLKGGFYFIVGDSTSGKTWLMLSALAEACRNPAFKGYRLVYDDAEGGALMDMAKYFGQELVDRIEAPSYDKHHNPVYSETVQDFYYHLQGFIDEGEPFIYVLDSQDGLDSEEAQKKFKKQRNASQSEDEEEVKGSYGDGKAKYHSQHLRTALSGVRRTKSILLVTGQTRDNLGFGAMFQPKIRSGGKALKFYNNIEIWLTLAGRIKRLVRGKERTIGIKTEARTEKNRVTGKIGKDRSVIIPIYYGYGLDDVGSCVDYLIENKHWEVIDDKEAKKKAAEEGKKKKGKSKPSYDAKEIMFEGTRDKIIRYIEEEDLEHKVAEIATRIWREIEEECEVRRKKRYE